jgi:hypothetical protein
MVVHCANIVMMTFQTPAVFADEQADAMRKSANQAFSGLAQSFLSALFRWRNCLPVLANSVSAVLVHFIGGCVPVVRSGRVRSVTAVFCVLCKYRQSHFAEKQSFRGG